MRWTFVFLAAMATCSGLRAELLPTEPAVMQPAKDPMPNGGGVEIPDIVVPILLDDPATVPSPTGSVDPANPGIEELMRENTAAPPSVPEPATLALAAIALGAVAIRRCRSIRPGV